MLKGKIHRATVTQAELNYVGSITVDTELLEAAGIMEYEYVQIVDVRRKTVLKPTRCRRGGQWHDRLNGAAARQVMVGDHVIIMSYASMSPEEAKDHKPHVVFVDDANRIQRTSRYEKHGLLSDNL